ncbi:MAG: ParA family protein [Pseudomonadota bacterium]
MKADPYANPLSLRELDALLGASAGPALAKAGLDRPPAGLMPDQARAVLAAAGHSYAPRVVAFSNLKGGVGKTTSAVHVAARAAQYGHRVCLLDLDSQASASLAFDALAGDDDPIFYDVWQKPAEQLPGALRELAPNLNLLPSALENGLLETALANPTAQKRAVAGVAKALQTLGFDLIVCDCPPSLGTAVISAVCAADLIVIPLGDDAFSFKGLELTLAEIKEIRATFGLAEPAIRLVLTRVDARLKLSGQAWRRLSAEHPGRLAPSPIRTSSQFAQALERRATVFAWGRQTPARRDYDALTQYLLGLDRLKRRSRPAKEAGHARQEDPAHPARA